MKTAMPYKAASATVILLLLLGSCVLPSHRQRMRHELDSLNLRNQHDLPFTAADVGPYLDFFDRHGTANDRLLANYLMGRAYHEQGDAPMALQYYQQAIECADTTSNDCDYKQLSKVYAQTEAILYDQNLFAEQLKYIDKAVENARKANDTLGALIEEEQKTHAYIGLGQIDTAIKISEHVSELFRKYGYKTDAAITLGGILGRITEKGDTAKASRYIYTYETQSGRFDGNGNVAKGHEIHYYFKGLLYTQKHQYDSAEYYFRKELALGKDFNNQQAGALGMAKLYEQRNMPDSAAKYYKYAYSMNDSAYTHTTSMEIETIIQQYNYTHHKEKAHKAEIELAKERNIKLIISIIAIIIIGVHVFALLYIRNKRKLELQRNKGLLSAIEQLATEIITLRTHESALTELIALKEEKISELRQQLTFSIGGGDKHLSDAESKLSTMSEYHQLCRIADLGIQPTDEEWHMIRRIATEVFPGFFDFLMSKQHLLNLNEYNVCILIRLHIKPTCICNMLGKSKSTITKMRINLLNKVFGKNGTARDFDEQIIKLY